MTLMECPKCGFRQPPAAECARCGVLVSKVHERPPLPAVPPSPPPAAPPRSSPLLPMLGFALATAALLVFLRPQKHGPIRPSRHQAEAARAGAVSASGWYEGAEGYRRADDERRRSGKPMALYFHTAWCGWCKKMDSEILDDSETSAYLAGLAKVRINPEDGDAEQALAREYGVRGFPTFLIVPASGGDARRVHPFQTDGTMSPAQFVAACRAAE